MNPAVKEVDFAVGNVTLSNYWAGQVRRTHDCNITALSAVKMTSEILDPTMLLNTCSRSGRANFGNKLDFKLNTLGILRGWLIFGG